MFFLARVSLQSPNVFLWFFVFFLWFFFGVDACFTTYFSPKLYVALLLLFQNLNSRGRLVTRAPRNYYYKNTPNLIRAPMAGPRCYFNNPNPMSGAYGSSYVYGKSGAIKRTISRIFETPILITNQKIIDHADTIPLGIRRLFSSRCIRRTTPLGAATDIGFLRNYEL